MTNIADNNNIRNILKLCSVLVIIAAGITGIVFFHADIAMLLILCAFLLFWVLVPGITIMRNLGYDDLHISTFLIRSFFMGFALNVLLYYISALIGTDIILYAVGPILTVILIVQGAKAGAGSIPGKVKGVLSGVPASFFVFAACVFLCSFFATQCIYISPEHCSFSFLKIDFSYHAGIINALSISYPPLDPWVDGLTIEYHFFSEMLLSVPEKLFGLPSEEMLMSGTPYLITPVFTIALYSFFREFSAMKERAGLYCLAFHFSNMFILKSFASSWFLYHIYSNVNNAGLGIACFLTALPLLRMWDRDASQTISEENSAISSGGRVRKFNTKDTLLLAVFVMLMTGIKGPIALVLVGGAVGTLLLGLILRKVDVKTVAMVVLAGISFLLIYVYVLGAEHSNTTGGSIINPGEVTDIFYLKEDIMYVLAGVIPRPAIWGVLLCAFTVFYLSAFLLPFVAGYLRELFMVLTGRKEFSFSKVTVYACFMVGFLGMLILDFNGHSQVYFGFAASVLVPMIAFWFFEDMRFSRSALMKFTRAVFIVSLCFFACTSVLYMYKGADRAHNFYLSRNESSNKYRNVTTGEYEGLIWLRENTDEEDLIASDRYYSVSLGDYDYAKRGSNTHFAYAVYSKRRQYLEGSGFSIGAGGTGRRKKMLARNLKMYDPANEGRGDLARDLSVDYVVVSKRFDDVGDLSNEDYNLCFSNDEMDIYEVKDAS